MMIFKILFSTWFSTMAAAALINGSSEQKTVELNTPAGKSSLSLAGIGIRNKKIAFLSLKIYDAHFYVEDLAAYKRTAEEALPSLDTEKSWAMNLKFLRTIDSKKLVAGFTETLNANAVSLDSPEVIAIFKAIGNTKEVKEGQNLSFALVKDPKNPKEETYYIENGEGVLWTGKVPSGAGRRMLSLWFGNTSMEAALDDLKKSLLKVP